MTRRYSIYAIDSNGQYPIYIVGDKDACVYNAILNEALNDAGTLTFTVPPTNPEYDKLTARVKILVFENEEVTWRGFVAQTSKNKNNELKVTAIGELGYLNDTIQPQKKYQNKTPTQLLTAYLAEHNAQSSETFTAGIVTVTDPNDNVYRFTNYDSTLTALRDDLCASLDGYLRIRYDTGVRYLDLVKINDYGNNNGQIIEFGSNLLDYSEGMSAEEIATQCLPLGARLDEAVVDGLDAYLDIKSVNGGVDYVQDDDAVVALGEVKRVVHFDNVTVASTLKTKAEQWLTTAQYAKISIQVSAIDLSALTVYIAHKRWVDFTEVEWQELGQKTWGDLMQYTASSLDPFRLGDRVRCFATPYGMDATFPIQEKTTYLQDPTKNVIVLSAEKTQTYTQMQAATTATVEKQNQSFLAQAQQVATDLIISCNGGYVYIKYGADGRAEELCIMDTNSPDTATKVWRWNLNGFGYSSTGYNGPYTTAITMNGAIVADFITTGTMLANRILGGTLSLGGASNGNGVIRVYDASNNEIGSWTRTGINVGKGTINGASMTLGGASNASGTLTVKDANGDTIGKWNKDGITVTGGTITGAAFTGANSIFKVTSNGVVEINAANTPSGYTTFSIANASWKTHIDPNSYYLQKKVSGSWTNKSWIDSGGFTFNSGDASSVVFNASAKTLSTGADVYGKSFTSTSKEEAKTDIKPLGKVLDKVKDGEIYSYKFVDEKKVGQKDHIGMVIGKEYNTPNEVIGYDPEGNPVGVDIYAMCSMLWKAVQELSEELDQLKGEKKDALDK